MQIRVVEEFNSGQRPFKDPNSGQFRYLGVPRAEEADGSVEELLDEHGRVRARREQWRVRRWMDPDPMLARRLVGGQPTLLEDMVGCARALLLMAGFALAAGVGAVVGCFAGAFEGSNLSMSVGAILGAVVGTVLCSRAVCTRRP